MKSGEYQCGVARADDGVRYGRLAGNTVEGVVIIVLFLIRAFFFGQLGIELVETVFEGS
jgi:hypothetical protein